MTIVQREKLKLWLKLGVVLLLGIGIWSGGSKQAAAAGGYVTNIQVSAGKNFSIGYAEYYYFAFGQNDRNQLGIGGDFYPDRPTYVTHDGVKSIASGANHTLFVTTYGTVEGFGSNEYYQANLESYHSSVAEPTEIPGLTGIIDAAAGDTFSAVLKWDGTVWEWGYNPNDDYLLTPTERAVQVKGALEGVKVKQIAAGSNTVYALAENGDLYEWGATLTGPIADPEDPHIIERGVEKISVSRYHSLLIKNGRAYAWGNNDFGMLGTGDLTTPRLRNPTPVNGLASIPVKDIAAGLFHSMALGEDGYVYVWGFNGYGQLGKPHNGGRIVESNPQPYRLSLKNVVSIAAGDYHSLAITKDKSIYAWGKNNYGQVGLPVTTTIQYVPYLVHNLRPSAPTGLTASKVDLNGNMTVRWNPNPESDLNHYILYWKKDTESTFKSTTVYGTFYNFIVKGVTDGKFVFKLKAVDNEGAQSEFSLPLTYEYKKPLPIGKVFLK